MLFPFFCKGTQQLPQRQIFLVTKLKKDAYASQRKHLLHIIYYVP